MRSGRHLSSTVEEHPRGQCDKNKLSLFAVESNSLTPYTSYLEIGEREELPGEKRNDLQNGAFIQKRIDCANQISTF